MRELADTFLREVERRPDLPEAGIARRGKGVTHLYAGEYVEARGHLERALAAFDPARDGDLTFRFGHDAGIGAMANLARALWPLGEVDRARGIVERMTTRLADIGHVATLAYAALMAAMFELMRRNSARAEPHARTLARLARENDMEQWKAFGVFSEGWLAWRAGDRRAGLADMRRGLLQLAELKIMAHVSLFESVLAEAEAGAGEFEAALASIDAAIRESERSSRGWFEAETHRIRGEILLRQNPADPAPAEAAFLAAIAIAQAQKARSFELRAALSLAKLYRATGRDAEAHAVLGPALEGFAPTPEFAEIAEAAAFMAAHQA